MRSREEQVADIENFCGTLAISGDIPNSHAIREWLKEAEERGFKRYLSKKTDHTAIDGSPSIKQWQHDQKEYFDPTIIEIIEEYAVWRDKKEAECAADTRRLDWMDSGCCDVRFRSEPIADTGDADTYCDVIEHHIAAPKERIVGSGETVRRAIDAAMEGGK